MPDIADNTDHLPLFAIDQRCLADRILARENRTRCGLVQNDDVR
jgi:hypothetical protein